MEKLVFSELKEGCKKSGLVLLMGIEEKETKTNSSFCKLTLSDGKGIIEANLWNTTKNTIGVTEKNVVYIELTCKLYQGSLSYEAVRVKAAPEECSYAVTDFIVKAPYEPEQMYNEILRLCHSSTDNTVSLVNIVETLYSQNKERLLYWSAAKSVHHNFYGGLLYHTFRMIRLASVIARVYPTVDTELLYCAVALHDIGKLVELETDSLGQAEYTIEGSLLSHSLIGIEMISQVIVEHPVLQGIDKERVMCLKHCIAAHHGKLEWGAIIAPQMLESSLLHEIDMIDSRVLQYEDAKNSTEKGKMSEKIFGLGTRVYNQTL